MQKGMEFGDNFLDKNGLDGYLKLPMSVESFTIPEELSAALKTTISKFKGIKSTAEQSERKYIEDFIAELKKNSEILNQFVDKEQILAKVFE